MKGMNLFNSSTPQGVLPVRKFTGAEVIPISIGITSKGNQPKYKSKDGGVLRQAAFRVSTAFVARQSCGGCRFTVRLSMCAAARSVCS